MYVAVAVYKEKKSIVGILFAIPVFILSGFEHSIADMGYFAIAGIYSAKAFGFIWLVILGNSIGALILPLLALAGKKLKKREAKANDNSLISTQEIYADKAEDSKAEENQTDNSVLVSSGATCEINCEVQDEG